MVHVIWKIIYEDLVWIISKIKEIAWLKAKVEPEKKQAKKLFIFYPFLSFWGLLYIHVQSLVVNNFHLYIPATNYSPTTNYIPACQGKLKSTAFSLANSILMKHLQVWMNGEISEFKHYHDYNDNVHYIDQDHQSHWWSSSCSLNGGSTNNKKIQISFHHNWWKRCCNTVVLSWTVINTNIHSFMCKIHLAHRKDKSATVGRINPDLTGTRKLKFETNIKSLFLRHMPGKCL